MKSAFYRQISESVEIQYQKDHHIIPNIQTVRTTDLAGEEKNSEMEKMRRGEKK